MAEKFSYGGQFSNKRKLQRIAFQKVWCEEMREEQFMNPTLISRTVIIGVRNIYDYPDALLEMNDLFKRRLQQNVLFVSSEKGPTYEQDLTYRDNLVDYTLSDDVTISHFFSHYYYFLCNNDILFEVNKIIAMKYCVV